MNKTFNTARANLAHSQSLVDRLHAPAQNPQEMAQPSPEMQPATQSVPEAPQPIQQEPQPTPPAPADTTPDPKTTQETIKELSDTIGTGFEALNKVADTLKDLTGKKKPKISDRIKARFNKPKE